MKDFHEWLSGTVKKTKRKANEEEELCGTVRCRSKNKETNKLCCVASHRFVDLPVGLEEAEVHAGFRETPKAARVAPTTFLKE